MGKKNRGEEATGRRVLMERQRKGRGENTESAWENSPG